MNKQAITCFFDELAPTWDAEMIRDDDRINKILDCAGVKEGVSVLDVACGTGVLFPDYLARNVKNITGVDISPAMIERARSKFADPRITLVAADIEEVGFCAPFDCCVVYNAFPHFPNPSRLIVCLAEKLARGGRLTIAHGMSRAAIDNHHSGSAAKVSVGLMCERALADILKNHFDVDVMISNDEMYVVSGARLHK